MGVLRNGVCVSLEAKADAYLHAALKDLPASQKTDVLTPWKLEDRTSREVYNGLGYADSSVRQGVFNRAYNFEQTHLNSVDCHGGYRRPNRWSDPDDVKPDGFELSSEMQRAFGIEAT